MNTEYNDTDTQFEDYEEVVHAQALRVNDIIHGEKVVTRKKVGTKWTEIFDFNDDKIARVLNDEVYRVTRQRETKASITAANRAYANRKLVKQLEALDASAVEARTKFIEMLNQGYGVRYDSLESLLTAEAQLKLWRRYEMIVDHASSDRFDPEQHPELVNADHYACFDAMIVEIKTDFFSSSPRRALSRSTSVLSNLLEDVESAQKQQFVHDARWYGYNI